ncbi:MAG TPA: hypothetical protein VE990_01300 [Acidimicrobiales bacterium]|nr:hypothetical protein [Acidimicrobiales bacterium]
MARAQRRSRSKATERWLPITYLGAVLALAVALLPSALRPPPQQQNQTAAFSPNAPPDQRQTLFDAIHQASSGTAGAGGPTAAAAPLTSTSTTIPNQPTNAINLQANYCPFGVNGKQTPNVYSPPCAPAWHGNNGGSTWRGVSPTQINVAITGITSQPSPNGALSEQVSASDSATTRTWKVFERYFNEAFQLWGRQIQFYVASPASSSETDEENEAVTADQQYHIFGQLSYSAEPMCQYYSQHQIVSWCGDFEPSSWYAQGSPPQMVYSWVMTGEQDAQFVAEYICKSLANRPAIYAGEADYHNQTRKFGMLLYDTRGYAAYAPYIKNDLKARCGVSIEMQYSDLDNTNGEQALAAAATKFKADGVTTVIPGVDVISAAGFTQAAASNDWFPEWLLNGGGSNDTNGYGQLQNTAEWAHAFGFAPSPMGRPYENMDCFRAYQLLDPGNLPDDNFCIYDFVTLYIALAGLQLAGPHLTPTTYMNGLYSLGKRYMAHPVWADGGGIVAGHPTYEDDVGLIWWNANAPDPTSTSGSTGAYEWENGGQRYQLGQLPSGPPTVFGSNGSLLVPDSYVPD